MRFDLAEITALATDYPGGDVSLSGWSVQIILSALTFVCERWRWNNAGDKLTETEWDQTDAAINAAIREVLNVAIFAGQIVIWPSDNVPAGWLLCNGAAISRDDYADLFAVIGTTYGNGDGSTTFNLPDMVGRVVVGRDGSQGEFAGLNQSGGEKSVTLNLNEMPRHRHGESTASNVPAIYGELLPGTTAVAASGNTDWAGNGSGHNNLQPYRVLNYIIKFQ